jgi:hypothetical protein
LEEGGERGVGERKRRGGERREEEERDRVSARNANN